MDDRHIRGQHTEYTKSENKTPRGLLTCNTTISLTPGRVAVFLTSYDAGDIEQVCRRVIAETIAMSLPQLTRRIDQDVRSGQLAYLLNR
ncbi:MAG TPA: hypothetical protein VEI53_04500 [Ktedonobacteraceae bacterium]|nr:hypothetical protein [Ktedonobacteraceae bacterium]